jgi:glutamine amidotransferase
MSNTHPFQYDNWTFAHNGTISNIEEVRSSLPKEYRSRIKGETDSETLFQWLMLNIDERGVETGLQNAISFVDKVRGSGSSSMNFLLTNGKELFAYRRAYKKWAEYTLHYLESGDMVAVSSDPLTSGKWTMIPNSTLLSVGADLGMSLTPF